MHRKWGGMRRLSTYRWSLGGIDRTLGSRFRGNDGQYEREPTRDVDESDRRIFRRSTNANPAPCLGAAYSRKCRLSLDDRPGVLIRSFRCIGIHAQRLDPDETRESPGFTFAPIRIETLVRECVETTPGNARHAGT